MNQTPKTISRCVLNAHDLSWHCLRHTFASLLVMAGVDLRTVQELMGHKSIEMTMRYAHLSPAHKLEAVQRLTGTTTGTCDDTKRDVREAVSKVVGSKEERGGDARTRTTDLGIMRPIKDDDEPRD